MNPKHPKAALLTALLALGLSGPSRAQGAPPKSGGPELEARPGAPLQDGDGALPGKETAPLPTPRFHHRRTQLRTSWGADIQSSNIPFRGRLEPIGDGFIRVSAAVPEGIRRRISERKRIPLRQVDERTYRTIYIDQGTDRDALRELVGQEVEASLRMNGRGFFYLESIRAATEGRGAQPPGGR